METDLLLNKEDEKKNYNAGVIKTVYLSICFMLLFSAFNSAENLVVPLYNTLGFNGLGNIALFSVYFSFALTCFFSA